jgi:hypothetical protein
MKSTIALFAGAASALALTLAPSAAFAHDGHGHDLLRSDLTPSLPTDAPIDGVNPGALPWQLAEGSVRVRSDGRTDVRIEGLQIPRNGGADNPIPFVEAVLYCGGSAVADSGPQAMTVPGGDARFRVQLSVPSTCTDATVLISPSTAVGKVYIASAVVSMGDDD